MSNIERCWIWTTRDPASGQVTRGVMFHKPEASRSLVKCVEFVPARYSQRAVGLLEDALHRRDWMRVMDAVEILGGDPYVAAAPIRRGQ